MKRERENTLLSFFYFSLRRHKESKKSKGFTIIEALVVLFIFALITVTFYSLFSVGTRYIIESKTRLKATSIANAKMEVIRSMDYSQIGIDGGLVGGDIPGFEQISSGDKTFYVFSNVFYVDDPYDGKEDESPDDDRPNDYKRLVIKVCWENDVNTQRSISLISDFAPPTVEGNIGGGTLVVKVVDRNANGISNFNVRVVNSGLGIDDNFVTDSNGGISLPGTPADGNDYEISISKNNYFPISTFPSFPTSTFYPVYVHASVTEGKKNIYSITTDQISDLTFKTQDPFGSVVQNIEYNLKGGLIKGNTVDNPPDFPTVPIFYYDQNLNSGSNGENQIDNISYGSYVFSFADSGGDYEFIKMFPYDSSFDDKVSFKIDPGLDVEKKAIFANKNINSLMVTVTDDLTSQPIKDASVRLYNLSLPEPYDLTLLTDDFGMVYFPNALPELVLTEYDLSVEATGYQNKTDTATINKYTKKSIRMEL
jgi:type II secretory pathway pseudopilin PulG